MRHACYSAGASGSSNTQSASVYNVHFLCRFAGSPFQKLSEQSVRRRLFVPLETLADEAEQVAQQVVASGLGTKQAVAGQSADVDVELAPVAAAFADLRNPRALSIGFAAPPGSDALFDELGMKQQPLADGSLSYKVSYSVSKPGKYSLLVQYGGHHIPGSPFEIQVSSPQPQPQSLT